MFAKPLPHFVIGPGPLDGLGISTIIFWPGRQHMVDKLLPALLRTAVQIMMAEVMNADLCLVQPRGMCGRIAGTPPVGVVSPIVMCGSSGMAGITILNQKHALQLRMLLPPGGQCPAIMLSIFSRLDHDLYQARVDHQKEQDVDGAMTGILKFLMFDRTGSGSTQRITLQHLTVRYLIDTNHPNAPFSQALSVSIAPQHLFCTVFELSIQPTRFPIAGAMRLQIHLLQQAADRARRDLRDDTVNHGLTGQIGTRPVRDMQPFGYRFKAGQLDNLRPLQGGKSESVGLVVAALLTNPTTPPVGKADRFDARSVERIASERRRFEPADGWRWPTRSVPAEPDTRVRTGFGPPASEWGCLGQPGTMSRVFDRAWNSLTMLRNNVFSSIAGFSNFGHYFCPETLAAIPATG